MKNFPLLLLAASVFLFSCQKEDTSTANLVKVTVKVTRVKVQNVTAVLDAANATFTALLPTETDFSSLEVNFATEAVLIRTGNRDLSAKISL